MTFADLDDIYSFNHYSMSKPLIQTENYKAKLCETIFQRKYLQPTIVEQDERSGTKYKRKYVYVWMMRTSVFQHHELQQYLN